MKKLILILGLVLCCSGCMNVVLRGYGEGTGSCYAHTTRTAIAAGDAIAGPWNGSLHAYQAHIRSQIYFPFLIIDLPCEIVVDTLLLPLDYFY